MSDAKNDSSGGGGAMLLAFVLGAIAGAAVALLVAPAAGRDTREFLGEKAREGVRKAKEAYAEATGESA
jgi:gas vesicle protein